MPKIKSCAIAWIALLFPLLSEAGETGPDIALPSLIDRILPGHSKDFVVETISPPPGENVFEVEAGKEGKIILRGDTPLSQAVAFNWYLKHKAFVSVSWYADDPVNVPGKLPLPDGKVRKTTKLQQRFFLNYCTFGYTMPFWRWRDWERFIDWMALNGINLPLAQTGNEYIWQKVWREYGLNDDEIRGYFPGPAHLPWHRMVNIDNWNGPLPQSYIDGQRDLQKSILKRERALGMSPVLCAFAGHVPAALKNLRPDAGVSQLSSKWFGFPPCSFLNPLDPMFHEIAVKFMQEQEKEYGTGHFYATDPFNEISPPKWDPEYLASVSKSIYAGMAEVDPGAVWLQMTWTFGLGKSWTNERLAAMIKAVPPGRMELLDYVCESTETFRKTEAFFGAPFLWCYLGNYGGHTNIVGKLERINQRLTDAMNDPSLTNFAGVGATLEGLNNPVVYELLFARAWDGQQLDLAEWIKDTARARAGGPDPGVEQAWDVLCQKILGAGGYQNSVVFQLTCPGLHPSEETDQKTKTKIAFQYSNADLIRAWKLLLQAGPAARESSAYQRDLVDVTRQALGNLGVKLRAKMAAACDRKDAGAFEEASREFMALGRDIDKLLGTYPEFLLGKWIGDAKSWAANREEEDYYEKNARTLITMWGYNDRLVDYANRQWNGLMADYYLPRWQLLIDATLEELKTGTPTDPEVLKKQYREHDLQFASTSGGKYPEKVTGDVFSTSRMLFEKYAGLEESTKKQNN